jgi:hypothetical protein
MDASKNILAVGTMYVAMGFIATMVISKIMAQSELGKQVLADFGSSVGKSLGRLGESLARILTPLLNVVATILELATSTPIVRELLAIFLILGTTILLVAGVVKMFTGAIGILTTMWGSHNIGATGGQMTLSAYGAVAAGVTPPVLTLGAALAMVAASLTVGVALFTVLNSIMGPLPAALFAVAAAFAVLAVQLWLAAGAMSVLSWGAAAVAGGAALAGAIAIATGVGTQSPEYQTGTRMFTKTGMGVFHKGEIAYNPENKLPTQVNRDLEGKGTSLRQDVTIDLSGSTIQTKADKEELLPMIKRGLRDVVLAKE